MSWGAGAGSPGAFLSPGHEEALQGRAGQSGGTWTCSQSHTHSIPLCLEVQSMRAREDPSLPRDRISQRTSCRNKQDPSLPRDRISQHTSYCNKQDPSLPWDHVSTPAAVTNRL